MNLIIDLSPLSAALEEANIKIDVFAHAAVGRVAEQLAQRWRDMVKHAPGIRPDERSEYLGSIDWDMTGDLSAVVQSTFKNASQIEEGRPAYDMKQMLQTSVRTKISKDGRRYLTIPMRHNTPGSGVNAPPMPSHIYNSMTLRNMRASSATGETNRVNGLASAGLHSRWLAVAASRNARGAGAGISHFVVPQNIYQWGGRLGAGWAPKRAEHHKTDPLAGMVKMKESSGGNQYLTMRTMVEGSPGWIRKATPGLFILRDVAVFTQADTGNILNELLAEMR